MTTIFSWFEPTWLFFIWEILESKACTSTQKFWLIEASLLKTSKKISKSKLCNKRENFISRIERVVRAKRNILNKIASNFRSRSLLHISKKFFLKQWPYYIQNLFVSAKNFSAPVHLPEPVLQKKIPPRALKKYQWKLDKMLRSLLST